jgi:hypothetical protein
MTHFPSSSSSSATINARVVKQSISKYRVSRPRSSKFTRRVRLQYGLNAIKINGQSVCEMQADSLHNVKVTAYYAFSEHYAILIDDVFSMRNEVSL